MARPSKVAKGMTASEEAAAKLAAAEEVNLPEGDVSLEEAEAAAAEELARRQAVVAEAQAVLDAAKASLREMTGNTAAKRGPVGVGAFIRERIVAGDDNKQIMEQVTEKFPANNTNINCINWYRNAIKNWPNGKRPSKKAEKPAESHDATAEEVEQTDLLEAESVDDFDAVQYDSLDGVEV